MVIARSMLTFLLALVVLSPAATAQKTSRKDKLREHRPHAGMLLYPDVSATQIVFAYANDLWVVPREGGLARPLASPPGRERFPRFSPDGKTVAFMGNYDGGMDLHTIPVDGGRPTRVTHHPAVEVLCDWTPDGKLLFHSNGLSNMQRQSNIFTVPATGGLPQKLPVPYGTIAAISPDGQWLAYTPHTRDMENWKRYRGGQATDIWLFHLKEHTWKQITDWEGTDTQPMWHGQTVYYLSDNGKESRLNIWAYDTATGKRRQVTKFNDYDVKWPAIGPGPLGNGEIVFQNGSQLYLLDLATEQSKTVQIRIPGDRRTVRPRNLDAATFVQSAGISPTGKRILLQARGDIWTLPANSGPPRNLTRSSGAFERDPAWSPDGRWIAYFSDKTGEYELYITQSDGRGETRQLTTGGKTFRTNPIWSPDSKRILFSDKSGATYLTDVATGNTKHVDTDPSDTRHPASWSPDSTWIAYAKAGKTSTSSAVWLYEVASGNKHQVTSGMFTDTWPTFGRHGRFLYFASHRRFASPRYDDLGDVIGSAFVYNNTDLLLAVPLRNDTTLPWAPKIDDETFARPSQKAARQPAVRKAASLPVRAVKPRQAKGVAKPTSLRIDLDGFERRAVILPVAPANYSKLASAADGALFYVRSGSRGSSKPPGVFRFDMATRSEAPIVPGTGSFWMSADGWKLLFGRGSNGCIAVAAPGPRILSTVSISGLNVTVDPRAEWKQILTDAWRIQRDHFYDPTMHGVNWPRVLKQYQAMLADCSTRDDVNYVIGEMMSELNVGHVFVGGGDVEATTHVPVGLLGCDFELHRGAFRIAKIYEGAAWDADARGPLSQPGVNVKAGDYLLAVNGTPLDTSKDPWAPFVGLAGKVTSITVSSKPQQDGSAREIVVRPLSSEVNLRYRAWVEKNRAYVAKKTGGRVGYIHVPDTTVNGQNELVRQFYGQRHLDAMIIDDRWNTGGQIPTRFIELLNRPVTNYWAVRNGRDWVWPPDAHHGPKCMLINGMSMSGGDAFPAYFRQAGLGKLIGRRTWGGLVGMKGNPLLIDGGMVTIPKFAYYKTDGNWGIEGHGVDPDIDVIDDPSKMVHGGDPQLDAGIAQMQKELKYRSYAKPDRPKYPVRTGIGVQPQNR